MSEDIFPMLNEDEQRINEEVYETELLGKPKNKEPEVLGHCPECLDDVSSGGDYTMVLTHTVYSNGTGEQSHTEFYHNDCKKIMEKRKYAKQ